jgi:hypothetical protein
MRMAKEVQRKIEFPAIRGGLVKAVFQLASADYHRLVWAKQRLEPVNRGYSGFEFVSNVFDDYDFVSAKAVGEVFYTEEEQSRTRVVLAALGDLYDRHDVFDEKTDSTYMSSSEWKTVMAAAEAAYEVLADNDRRYANE